MREGGPAWFPLSHYFVQFTLQIRSSTLPSPSPISSYHYKVSITDITNTNRHFYRQNKTFYNILFAVLKFICTFVTYLQISKTFCI